MKVFITGSSSGLGLHLAKEFVSQGDMVWGIGRRMLDAAGEGFPLSKAFTYSECDTTDPEMVRNTFSKMIDSDFIPDTVIFCAGDAIEDIIENNFKVDKFKDNFDINLFGVLNWIEVFLPVFLKRNRGIFAAISSMSIYRENHRKKIGYSASKLSLNKAFENLRLEYFKTDVKFVIFNMGGMKEKKDFIGTSYAKAATRIAKILKSGSISDTYNIPFFQYFLTRITMYIPDGIYYKYILK